MKIQMIDTCPYCRSHEVEDHINYARCRACGSIDEFTEAPQFEQQIPRLDTDLETRIDALELRQLRSQAVRLQAKIQSNRIESWRKEADGEIHNREDITDRLYK